MFQRLEKKKYSKKSDLEAIARLKAPSFISPNTPRPPHTTKGQHRESQRQRSQAKSESPAPFPGAARASKALSAPKRGSGQRDPRPDRGARARGRQRETPTPGAPHVPASKRDGREAPAPSGPQFSASLNFLVTRRRRSAGQANCNKRRPGSATGERRSSRSSCQGAAAAEPRASVRVLGGRADRSAGRRPLCSSPSRSNCSSPPPTPSLRSRRFCPPPPTRRHPATPNPTSSLFS